MCLWKLYILCLYLFQFPTFNTEYYFDNVYIYEGNVPKRSALLGKFTGHRTPATRLSRSNRILIRFVSDYSDQRLGFVIKWKAGNIL